MCKNSKRFLPDSTAPSFEGVLKNLLKEIESCHGWISPVIVGHIS